MHYPEAEIADRIRLSSFVAVGVRIRIPLFGDDHLGHSASQTSTRCSTRSRFGYHVLSSTWQSPVA
jgi:hypothetical protein